MKETLLKYWEMLFKNLVTAKTAKTDMHVEFYLQSDDHESRRFFA